MYSCINRLMNLAIVGFILSFCEPAYTQTPTMLSVTGLSRLEITLASQQAPSPLGQVVASLPEEIIPFGVVVHNRSDRDLTGLALTVTGFKGKARVYRLNMQSDSYSTTETRPVLRASDRMLVFPGGLFIPETMINRYRAGSLIAPSRSRTVAVAARFSGSSEVQIVVDSAIYDDGLVEGANTVRLDDQIKSRKLAAESILNALADSRANNQPDKITLAKLATAEDSVSRNTAQEDFAELIPSNVGMQQVLLAQRLMRTTRLEAHLNNLRKLPWPPSFFKSQLVGGK